MSVACKVERKGIFDFTALKLCKISVASVADSVAEIRF
jgi:hypothetical protein